MTSVTGCGEESDDGVVLAIVSRRVLRLAALHEFGGVDPDLVTFGILDAASERAIDRNLDVESMCRVLRRVHDVNVYMRMCNAAGGEA